MPSTKSAWLVSLSSSCLRSANQSHGWVERQRVQASTSARVANNRSRVSHSRIVVEQDGGKAVSSLYRILNDHSIDDRWHLRAPQTDDGLVLDARDFLSCHRYEGPIPLQVRLRRTGAPLQFSFGDFDMPVVSTGVRDALASISQDGVQFVPIAIEGTSETYWILKVLGCHKCIDEQRSEFMTWTPEDGRPDKIGQDRTI